MAIQLEPVELDISDALNDIDTLKKHIEDAFKSHGNSDNPKVEKTLQGLRKVYNSLNDIDQKMKSMEFDPEIASKVEKVNSEFNNISKSLEQSKARVADFENFMKNANFDMKIGEAITKLDDKIDGVKGKMATLKDSIENTLKVYPEFKFFDNAEQEVVQIKDKIADLNESLKVSKSLVEEYAQAYKAKHGFALNEDMAKIKSMQLESRLQEKPNDKFAQEEYALIEAWRDEQNAVRELQQEISRLNDLKSKAKSYGKQTEQLKQLENQIENLSQKREKLRAQEEQQAPVVDAYKQENQQLENLGKNYTDVAERKKALEQQLSGQNKLANDFQKASESATILGQRLNQVTDSNNRASRSSNNLKSTFDSIKKAVTNVLSHVKSFAKSVVSHIKSVFSSLLGHVKSIAKSIGHSLSSKFGSLGKSASGLTGSLEGGFKKAFKVLLKYGLGVRSLFFLFRKLRAAATESLGEMAKQIPEVNKQMSSLKQSMNQMKGSLGTMIQPLLNILVPVLTKIAALVTSLTEKIASFFALLTGQSYIVSATAGAVDYAESLDKTGKSAKKAKKELQGYLSPIDEINKYTEKNKDEDDSGSGAGGGGITYKKKEISDDMKKLFDWLKDMWEKGDFFELGKLLGDKLAEALGKIPWDKIKAAARKLGSSLATLINGFIQGEFDGKSVSWWIGHTIAEAINTAFEFLNEFVHKLDWKGIGKAFADFWNGLLGSIDWELIRDTWITGLHGISDAINEFINNFDWDNISKTVSNLINIFTEGMVDFLTNTNFKELGTKLGDQFRKIIENVNWEDVGKTLGLFIKDAFDFAVSFLQQQSWESIKTALHDILMGFLEGLGLSDEQVDGIMSWVGKVEAIFEDLLGVLSDIWKAIQPLVTDIINHIIDFVAELPDKLNSIRESKGFQNFLNWLSGLTWEDIKRGITGVATALGVLAGAFATFKGVTAIGKVATALSSIMALFGGGGAAAGAVASAGGSAVAGGGILGAMGTILAVIGVIGAVILAAGALKQIPGFEWLMKEGIDMLKTFFSGIGEVIGSAISGIGVGLTSGLPEMADNLSEFGQRLQPFLDSINSIDRGAVGSVGILAGVIAGLTATDIVNTATSWLTGGNAIDEFGAQLVSLGRYLVMFSDSIKGIDGSAVQSAAIAGQALASMADTIPNTGGLVSWFAGNNDIDTFGEKLPVFGAGLKKFSDSVKGIDGALVQQAAIAGQAMAEMASTIPNTGGVVSWFTGNNDIDVFGEQLVVFGKSLKKFSDSIKGINGELIQQASIAGKAMTEMAKTIPNTGGLVSWFTGNNDMDEFGLQLESFGKSMKRFYMAVKGIDAGVIQQAVTCGKALTELANTIPNSTGLINIFTGSNDMDDFGEQLVKFGMYMRLFSIEITGVDTELVMNAGIAGQALANMASALPNEGGIGSWFSGGIDMTHFAEQLPLFGRAMKKFSDEVDGINPSLISSAATAGTALARMAQELPNEGGIVSWFAGNNNMDDFAKQLPIFGRAMKTFSDEVTGLDVQVVQNATVAGKALAEMAKELPNTGGIVSWFAGNNDMDAFGKQLVVFGRAMKLFADEVAGLDVAVITSAVTIGKTLINLAKDVPNSGGLVEFFVGNNDIGKFGKQLVLFGKYMTQFSDVVSGLNVGVIEKTVAITKTLVDLNKEIPKMGGMVSWFTGKNDFKKFGKSLVDFAESLAEFSQALAGVNLSSVPSLLTGVRGLVDLAKELATTNTEVLSVFAKNAKSFATQFGGLGLDYVNSFLQQFVGSVVVVNTTITTFVGYIIQAFVTAKTRFGQVAAELIKIMLDTMLSKSNEFKAAGVTLTNAFVSGFSGIGSGMTKQFNSGISSLKKIWNDFADWLNKRLNIEIDTSKAFGSEIAESLGTKKLNIGKIPRLAQGAVIPPNREFMAVLGDQNKGTNIETPLATMVDAFNQALAMNGGNGQSITLNLMLPDRKTVAQYAIEGGQVLQMSRGYNPFLLERG